MAKKNKRKRYLVKAEYGCRVETTIEADDEKDAEQVAMGELDELASQNLSQRDLKVEEVP